MERDEENRLIDRGVGSPAPWKSFILPNSCKPCACVCEGLCRKETGKLSPSSDKGRRWLALLSFGVGWCKQTPATERRALPWSSFQFPTERDGGQGGPAYNKKGLETLIPLPKTLTPPHHWLMTLAPHQVTCTVTKVGGMPKQNRETGSKTDNTTWP